MRIKSGKPLTKFTKFHADLTERSRSNFLIRKFRVRVISQLGKLFVITTPDRKSRPKFSLTHQDIRKICNSGIFWISETALCLKIFDNE